MRVWVYADAEVVPSAAQYYVGLVVIVGAVLGVPELFVLIRPINPTKGSAAWYWSGRHRAFKGRSEHHVRKWNGRRGTSPRGR